MNISYNHKHNIRFARVSARNMLCSSILLRNYDTPAVNSVASLLDSSRTFCTAFFVRVKPAKVICNRLKRMRFSRVSARNMLCSSILLRNYDTPAVNSIASLLDSSRTFCTAFFVRERFCNE